MYKTAKDMSVTYVDHMGNDLTVVNSARISFGKEKKRLTAKDKKLISYLAKHSHFTPFEHCQLTVVIDCPLYIRSQIMRHRTFSYNEISRRYTSEHLSFYEPRTYRKQHNSSKQCSDGDLDNVSILKAQAITQLIHQKCLTQYENLIKLGVSREMARGVLPQNLMTSFYMTGNLRNWSSFIKLRLDNHAQLEAQEIAKKIKDIIEKKFPFAGKALLNE
jgi:thymidylate synthase (FAD)